MKWVLTVEVDRPDWDDPTKDMMDFHFDPKHLIDELQKGTAQITLISGPEFKGSEYPEFVEAAKEGYRFIEQLY